MELNKPPDLPYAELLFFCIILIFIPNSFDQSVEPEEYNYTFYTLHKDGKEGPKGR